MESSLSTEEFEFVYVENEFARRRAVYLFVSTVFRTTGDEELHSFFDAGGELCRSLSPQTLAETLFTQFFREAAEPQGGDDGFLCGFHFCSCGIGVVFVAGEVKQAVDEIPENFPCGRFMVFGSLAKCGFRADHDFPVVEGDDVGGTFDGHEVTV